MHMTLICSFRLASKMLFSFELYIVSQTSLPRLLSSAVMNILRYMYLRKQYVWQRAAVIKNVSQIWAVTSSRSSAFWTWGVWETWMISLVSVLVASSVCHTCSSVVYFVTHKHYYRLAAYCRDLIWLGDWLIRPAKGWLAGTHSTTMC